MTGCSTREENAAEMMAEAALPLYRAIRSSNRRESEQMEFRAENDEEAVRQILAREEAGDTDWDSVEDGNDIADAPDATFTIERNTRAGDWRSGSGWAVVAKDIRVAVDMPYTDDARAFAQKVAAIPRPIGRVLAIGDVTLDELIAEARRICGLDADAEPAI